MAVIYLVQHAEKRQGPGDPGLTRRGLAQAGRTGAWLRGVGLVAIYSSPLRRARRTAQLIADATGLGVTEDGRLRERMNWDGDQTIDEFMAAWARTSRERDFVPDAGESSRQAGNRLVAFLQERADDAGPVAAVTHGGVTIEFLRNTIGDHALPTSLMAEGVPACALTLLDGLSVIDMASTTHLA